MGTSTVGTSDSGEKDTSVITVSPDGPDHAQQAGNRPFRLRNSCDNCQDMKLKCTQSKPACSRCIRIGLPCVYSPIRRLGRPRKNSDQPNSQQQRQKQQRQQQQQQQQQKQKEKQQLSLSLDVSTPASNGVGNGEANSSANSGGNGWAGDEPIAQSMHSHTSPDFHELIPFPADALQSAILGIIEEDSRTIIAPGPVQASAIDPTLSATAFETAIEDLSSSDPTSHDKFFATSIADITFEDMRQWTQSPESTRYTAALEHLTTQSSGMASRPTSSVTDKTESSTASSTSDPLAQREPSIHPHRQSLFVATSSASSSASSCSSGCYRCLSQQLAGLNHCRNSETTPNAEMVLQLERNMQSLSQRLLHCSTCLGDGSSLLLLSIIVDQVVRLLENFIGKVEPRINPSDHLPQCGIGIRSMDSLSHPVQLPAHTMELRIGDYEILDEDFKLTFLRRLLRHRLRLLVGMLMELQQTAHGQGSDSQCNTTYQTVREVVDRVERLRGKMALNG
ncbi:Sterigmatocystin biosynthesis regulatory protein [Madurella mycetomatis]|uniref:Sterigmatocystin biosynthesis regulatory protein n=1 Tax=Madurella mycetomatis TaxID=100816 RepID=A0A175WHL7_9PEZI|nr:Sterigmatocystin biosynthesis regulatory protein [Madurella mycetomatis]